jgi:hypothetical protein
MNFIERLKIVVYNVFHPSFWYMAHPYNAAYDQKFSQYLDQYNFGPVKYQYITSPYMIYIAVLGDMQVWVQNYPYNAFSKIMRDKNGIMIGTQYRPSRENIRRAKIKFEADRRLWT